MYKVYFEESFFEGLNDFVLSMKNYYFNFYSNTGIYDEDKIVEGYFEKQIIFKSDNDFERFYKYIIKELNENDKIKILSYSFMPRTLPKGRVLFFVLIFIKK